MFFLLFLLKITVTIVAVIILPLYLQSEITLKFINTEYWREGIGLGMLVSLSIILLFVAFVL